MQSELETAWKEARSMYDGADRGKYIGEERVRGTTYYFYYNGKEYLYETDYDRKQEEKRRKRDEERRKTKTRRYGLRA
uniref:Uncharacterized protein n=1 Tax=Siphoviridae sp. ctkJH11 TaxID=2825641 RepID=A0A8S5PQS8_9CAUD|nr:MAG TPA: hypothetical protein [Siphoviridae sp. ctkJH11]